MTRTILLLPAEDDPHGLCHEGAFGARPPTMWRTDPAHAAPPGYESGAVGWSDPSKVPAPLGAPGPYHGPYGGSCYRLPQQSALVVFHNGAVVPEGWDRMRWCAWAAGCSTWLWWALSNPPPAAPPPLDVADTAAGLLNCRVILLDADGKEVSRG